MEPYIDDTFYRLTGLNLRLTVGLRRIPGPRAQAHQPPPNFQTDYLQGFQTTAAGRRRSTSGWRTT